MTSFNRVYDAAGNITGIDLDGIGGPEILFLTESSDHPSLVLSTNQITELANALERSHGLTQGTTESGSAANEFFNGFVGEGKQVLIAGKDTLGASAVDSKARVVYINMIEDSYYLGVDGKFYLKSLERNLVHELQHINLGVDDVVKGTAYLEPNVDYVGPVVRATNTIMSGLGEIDRISYHISGAAWENAPEYPVEILSANWSNPNVAFGTAYIHLENTSDDTKFDKALLDKSDNTGRGDTFNYIDDLLVGAEGSDIIWGGIGNDFLYGEAGNDTLFGGSGSDYLNGGAGFDAARYDEIDSNQTASEAGVIVQLIDSEVIVRDSATSQDLLVSVEQISLTRHNDVLELDGSTNEVLQIDAEDTPDNSDIDLIDARNSETAMTIDLSTGATLIGTQEMTLSNFENVTGSAYDDTITGDDPENGTDGNIIDGAGGNDTIDGRGGDDLIIGGLGSDSISGGEGHDLIFADSYAPTEITEQSDSLYGGAGDDILVASQSGSELYGGADEDFLLGGDGNDTIEGGDGADLLIGGGGDDLIVSRGNDIISGGAGNDIIDVTAEDSQAVLYFDENSGSDQVLQSYEGGGISAIYIDGFSIGQIDFDYQFNSETSVLISESEEEVDIGLYAPATLETYVVSGTFSVFITIPDGTAADGTVIHLGDYQGTQTHYLMWDPAGERTAGIGSYTRIFSSEDNIDLMISGEEIYGTLINQQRWLGFDEGSVDLISSFANGIFDNDGLGGNGDFSPNGASTLDNIPSSYTDQFMDNFDNPYISLGGSFPDGLTSLDNFLSQDVRDAMETLSGSGSNGGGSGGGGNTSLEGSSGDDTFNVQTGVNDNGQNINAGDGNDSIYDGAGNDMLFGGNGQDRFFAGGGADSYDGGNHQYDEVAYNTSQTGLTIDMTNAANSTGIAAGDTFVDIERISGSNFDDVIVLSGSTAVYNARGGNDIIVDGDGLNALRGGAGSDTFQFGAGDGFEDRIHDFTSGEDIVDISAWGVTDFDQLTLTMHSNGNAVVITYGTESLRLDNYSAADMAELSASDFVFAENTGPASDGTISGTSGADVINIGYVDLDGDVNTGGDQIIIAGEGNDTIYDGTGDDMLYGGAGQDRFFAGAGADSYDGGDHHYDEVLYSTSQTGLTIDMTNAANSTGIAAGDTYVDIERIRGSNFDDIIILSGNASVYDARSGDDLIIDGDGLNTMRGGAGADTFQFGAGDGFTDQIYDFTSGEDLVDISAWGVTNFNQLTLTMHGNGNAAIISYGNDSVRLGNYSALEMADLSASDFVFA